MKMNNRLHPRGALRARFQPPPDDVFRRLGVGAKKLDLGDEGLYLAEELVWADPWLGDGDREVLGILVLALMIAQHDGSTRLPLDPKGPLRGLVTDIARMANMDLDVGRTLKAIASLTAAPRFTSMIGVGDARRPLIVDDGALYTERARWLEGRVARALGERLAVSRQAVEVTLDATLSVEQATAVKIALGGKLAVVTGGPGTGKTVVAAAIIRGFMQLGIEHVALAAQTGKAANRLSEVIAAQLGPTVTEPPIAQTLHRLLGSIRGGRAFRHNRHAPLPVGALIVDEASMIDLELMDALLDALPPSAPLVLVGDRHQLPAIDAGQILADLVDLPDARGRSVAVLEHSYRMDAGNPRGRAILAAAAAVNSGGVAKLFGGPSALAVPRAINKLAYAGVEWIDTSVARDSVTTIADFAWHQYGGPRGLGLAEHVFRFVDGECAEPALLDELWATLGRGRILTVTRGMATGSMALNAHLHGQALARLSITHRPDFVPGEPVMVTQNDYQRGLFNGDQGIIIRADEGLEQHHFRAVFKVGGRFAIFSIEALRDRLELAWAITVHKAQGSEMDAITLVLPLEDNVFVTRELVYTGMTRARHSVVLAAPRPVILAGGKRTVHRFSGLATRLERMRS